MLHAWAFCLYFHRQGPAPTVEAVSSVVCWNWYAGNCLLPTAELRIPSRLSRTHLTALSLFRRGKSDVRFKGRCRGGKQAGYGERAQSYYVMARMHVRKASKYPTRIVIRSWNDGCKRAINACLRTCHLQGFVSTTKLQQRVFHFHPPAPPLAHDALQASIDQFLVHRTIIGNFATNQQNGKRSCSTEPCHPQKDVHTGDALALTCRSNASSTSRLSTTGPDSEHLALRWSS